MKRITELSGCHSQWEGRLHNGDTIYIRYGRGILTLEESPCDPFSFHECRLAFRHDDGTGCGVLHTDELLEIIYHYGYFYEPLIVGTTSIRYEDH